MKVSVGGGGGRAAAVPLHVALHARGRVCTWPCSGWDAQQGSRGQGCPGRIWSQCARGRIGQTQEERTHEERKQALALPGRLCPAFSRFRIQANFYAKLLFAFRIFHKLDIRETAVQ